MDRESILVVYVEYVHAVIFSQMMHFVKVVVLKRWSFRQWNFLLFLSLLRFALTSEEFHMSCAFYDLIYYSIDTLTAPQSIPALFMPVAAYFLTLLLFYLTC